MSYFSYQKGDRWWVRATVITVAVINYSFTGYLICEWRRPPLEHMCQYNTYSYRILSLGCIWNWMIELMLMATVLVQNLYVQNFVRRRSTTLESHCT